MGRYQQWIRLLAPGLLYRLLERRADEAESGVEHSIAPALVSHDYPSLCQLARDLADGRRRCPAPQVQLRRLITNLSVSSAVHRQYEIVSYILLSWVSTEVPWRRCAPLNGATDWSALGAFCTWRNALQCSRESSGE